MSFFIVPEYLILFQLILKVTLHKVSTHIIFMLKER